MGKGVILNALVLVSLVLVLAGFANAQTLVTGKVYNSDYSGIVSGASVSVTCNDNTNVTDSINDGSYAVVFDSGICTNLSSVTVSATEGSRSGSGTGEVGSCVEANCDSQFISVVNPNLKETSNPPSRSSGTHTVCGNGICESGENSATCSQDCGNVIINLTSPTLTCSESWTCTAFGDCVDGIETRACSDSNRCGTERAKPEESQSCISQPVLQEENQTGQQSNGGITGAVIGALGVGGTIFIFVFVIFVLGVSVIVLMRRRNAF
jgi:hypothetical protein